MRIFVDGLLLQDIVQNKDIHLDGILVASLVFDLLKVSPESVSSMVLISLLLVRGTAC